MAIIRAATLSMQLTASANYFKYRLLCVQIAKPLVTHNKVCVRIRQRTYGYLASPKGCDATVGSF